MAATPAWPPASTPRLFHDAPLALGAVITLTGNPAHYLAHVMRSKVGDPVLLFDDVTGEWLAEVTAVAKRDMTLTITQPLGPREAVPDIWLCFAPLKKAATDWLVEKATELGAARLVPVITQRTIAQSVRLDRLRAITIEAAEQCGRTALPALAEPVKLAALLAGWPAGRALLHADEAGGAPMLDVLAGTPGPCALLIGPEGGFTDDERARIHAHGAARAISLGPRILRAETAALAALTLAGAARSGLGSTDG